MTHYSLSNAAWRLKGVAPHVPLQGNIMETGRPFRGLTPWLDCTVPGGVHLALYRAGWLEYPYYNLNSLKCEWVENRWWMYETTIPKPILEGKRFRLEFLGVDYEALIYLNNHFLGEHEGMYEPFSYDITEEYLRSDSLKVQVMIKNAPEEVGQVGRTSETTTQKARFNYKWDFGTRLVNLGIWEDVRITAHQDHDLGDLSITSDVAENGTGLICCGGAASPAGEGLTVLARVSLEGEAVTEMELPVEGGRFCGTVTVPQPRLWWPNGHGEQSLYDVELILRRDGEVQDRFSCKQGIRRLRFLQNDNAPQDAMPYTYEVNGKRIYIKGVNITPLDHIYGDIPLHRYETTLRAIVAMNVNLIRVWGGGIIEKKCFYDLCDRYGILVWQEFIQSSSGIENVPSKDPHFLELLAKAARCAVTRCRNHTSLAAWSGGNELQDLQGRPSGFDDSNLAMLKTITDALDPGRILYPTSAGGPSERQSKVPNTSHDVHGDWEYGGNPDHYPAQALADHLFNSEFGCSGVSGPKTASRVLPPEERRPADMGDNALWRFRGDWWCTYQRDVELFGPMKDLPRFTAASQWIQAEAVRYTVEANRRRAFRNSGSVIWQFNEPWPNIACTCLYTYYDDPKMAYFWAKQAYSAYHVSLDYRRLDYVPGSRFRAQVWLSQDHPRQGDHACIQAEVLAMDGTVLQRREQACLLENVHSQPCMTLDFPVPEQAVFAVRLTAGGEGGRDQNIYYFSTCSQEIYAPFLELPKPELAVELVREADGLREYCVTNRGASVALHIHAFDEKDCCVLLPEEDFFTLWPGQSRRVTLHLRPRQPYGFDEYRGWDPEDKPNIRFLPFPLDGAAFG